MTGLDRIGEILEEKTGGVNPLCEKTPAERDPLALLHGWQALTQFSGLKARSGASLIGIT